MKKKHAQPAETIGAMLAAKREALGIPIERAAKDSRIRVPVLRAIEADDFSELSNPSYVRMFLIGYSKYLGIPRDELDEFLPEQGLPGSENYQYIEGPLPLLPTIRPQPKPLPSRRKRLMLTLVTSLIIATVIGLALVTVWVTVTLPRFTSDETAAPQPEIIALDTAPVVPPGSDTVASDAFESEIAISVTEMAFLPTPVEPENTLPDRDPDAELPPATAATDEPQEVPDNVFAEDMEFLLGATAEEPTATTTTAN